jgi:hypothetical protein
MIQNNYIVKRCLTVSFIGVIMSDMSELSLQNDNVRYKIRTMILSDMSFKDIQATLGLSPATWDVCFWRNTQGFRDFVKDCQDERLRTIARENIKDIIQMDVKDNEDVRYLKIKADMSQFIAETIEKDRFSKKTEDNKDERTPINIQVNTYKKIQNLKKRLAPPNKP